jgi:predicted transcriptional regulator
MVKQLTLVVLGYERVSTRNEPQLDAKDKSILKNVKEQPGIRQIELARNTGLSVNCLRWRARGLSARGLIRIVSIDNKVTVFPAEAVQ